MLNSRTAVLKQYLVFTINNEEFGADIEEVTTIIEKNYPIARVPKTPDFIKGVINLRGEIIPIIDLRIRLNLPEIEATEATRIIVVNLKGVVIGLIVDSVAEVVNLSEESIETLANLDSNISMDYIYGVGKIGGRIITIFNLDKLVKIEEI